MFCPTCQTENSDGSKFCKKCGSVIATTETKEESFRDSMKTIISEAKVEAYKNRYGNLKAVSVLYNIMGAGIILISLVAAYSLSQMDVVAWVCISIGVVGFVIGTIIHSSADKLKISIAQEKNTHETVQLLAKILERLEKSNKGA